MYAIVDIAGQQFKVEAGKEIFVNRLKAAKDAEVSFDKVLLIDEDGNVKIGAPYVEGAVVKATVIDDTCRADKVLVFKKKRRKGLVIVRTLQKSGLTRSLNSGGLDYGT